MASGTDFSLHMRAVALELLGDPNPAHSSKSELRWGTNGSFSIDVTAGTWFDHEAKEGGGVLDLIARETGRHVNGAAGGAVEWLREHGYDVEDNHDRNLPAPVSTSKAPAGKKTIDEIYEYVDESGELLFQAVRFVFIGPDGKPLTKDGKVQKTFGQRRRALPTDEPDKVHDGWRWSVKGCRLVPYRLPDLLEALSAERPVFIVEGERKVDRLAELGVPATCNPMGSGKWPETFGDFFRDADIIHLSDNDEAGRNHTAVVGAALTGIAARQRVLDLPDLPAKGDVVDWIAKGGDATRLYDLVEKSALPFGAEAPRLNFEAVWFGDSPRMAADTEWLIDDLITRGDISMLIGASGSGKSFLATHFAMGVARAEPVFGHKVLKRGGVVYLAAEGRKGFPKRLQAYRQHFDISDHQSLPFVFLPIALNLFTEEGDFPKLLADLKILGAQMRDRFQCGIDMTVVDTHAAVSPGANENASEDVSRLLKHYNSIQETTGGHVMIVHHKNAMGARERGHSSFRAAVDNAIEVNCAENKDRSFKITKMKDAEEGFLTPFRLQSITLGARDDGRPITSCVVVPLDKWVQGSLRSPTLKNLTPKVRIALDALRDALLEHGEVAPGSMKLPEGVRVVKWNFWIDAFTKKSFEGGEDSKPDAVRKALQRAGEYLLDKRVIGREKPYVWIVREEKPAASG